MIVITNYQRRYCCENVTRGQYTVAAVIK